MIKMINEYFRQRNKIKISIKDNRSVFAFMDTSSTDRIELTYVKFTLNEIFSPTNGAIYCQIVCKDKI